jgi:hypothetical protein
MVLYVVGAIVRLRSLQAWKVAVHLAIWKIAVHLAIWKIAVQLGGRCEL